MSLDTDNPKEAIAIARPNLKDNTIKQYESNLNKLKKIFDADDWEFLKDPQEVKDNISHLHFTSQRNHYNAIIVLLMALNQDEKYSSLIEDYGEMRDELNDQYNKQSGTISDKQAPNFATMEEINQMINKMGEELKAMKLRKKESLTSKEKALLQIFVLFNLYSKIPLRNDVADGMESIRKAKYNKLSTEDKKSKNWLLMEKNKLSFVLNNYKTNKTYGQKTIDIEDKDLKRLLRYYIKVNGDGILFKSSTGKPLTRNALSQLLLKWSKKYMNKSVSTTLMRKIVASHHFGEGTEFAKLKQQQEDLANKMGHSVGVMNKVYIKEDKDE